MSTTVASAHAFVRARVRPGARVVDATAGRGQDTEFLARLVGEGGQVFACDVQPAAVASTRRRWAALPPPKGALKVYEIGHESLAQALAATGVTAVQAVMFNLGYLPRSDHQVMTRPTTTMAALTSLLPLLEPGGALTVVAYPRHPGGREEADAVIVWARQLPRFTYAAELHTPLNQGEDRPILIAITALPSPGPPAAAPDVT